MIDFLDHVNLVVDDLNRMAAFHRDLLGLQITQQATISAQWIEAVVGLSDAEADVIYLGVQTECRKCV